MCIYIYIYREIFIYIYREREIEKERERERHWRDARMLRCCRTCYYPASRVLHDVLHAICSEPCATRSVQLAES